MIDAVRTRANSAAGYSHVYGFGTRTYGIPVLSGGKVRRAGLL